MAAGADSASRSSARSARSADGWGQRPDGSTRPLHRPLSGGAPRGSAGQRAGYDLARDGDGAVFRGADIEHESADGKWSFLPPIVGRGIGRR